MSLDETQSKALAVEAWGEANEVLDTYLEGLRTVPTFGLSPAERSVAVFFLIKRDWPDDLPLAGLLAVALIRMQEAGLGPQKRPS